MNKRELREKGLIGRTITDVEWMDLWKDDQPVARVIGLKLDNGVTYEFHGEPDGDEPLIFLMPRA